MLKLEKVQKRINDFLCAAISAEYNTNWEKPVDLQTKADDLIQIIQEYTKEITEEQKEIKENDRQ